MSWDVSFFAAEAPPPPVTEMPDDWRGESLGTLEEVRGKISGSAPEVNWSDPSWGTLYGEGFSLEFNIGRNDPCYGFMVHVRGAGDAVRPLLAIGEKWCWYLLDTSQGEWLHHLSDVEAGWVGFQEYRDRVIRRSESK